MSDMKSETPVVDYMTLEKFYREMVYYNEKREKLEMKVRLLVRILVDKNIIGTELAKTFEETCPEELVKWYLESKKVK